MIMLHLAGMTLGQLITALIDLDLEHPQYHDLPVTVESDERGDFWIVVHPGSVA